MVKVCNVPRPLAELVEKVLARGDDSAPQDSRGAWSEERLAGWRTDPDVTARLAALTSLDFSEDVLETSVSPYQMWPGVGDKVKRMLSSHCFLCVCTCIVSSFHCLCSRMLSVWRSFLCVCKYLSAYVHSFVNGTGKRESVGNREQSCASARVHARPENPRCTFAVGLISADGLRRSRPHPPSHRPPLSPAMLPLTLFGYLSAIWTDDPRIKRVLPCSPPGRFGRGHATFPGPRQVDRLAGTFSS